MVIVNLERCCLHESYLGRCGTVENVFSVDGSLNSDQPYRRLRVKLDRKYKGRKYLELHEISFALTDKPNPSASPKRGKLTTPPPAAQTRNAVSQLTLLEVE